jgi:hypothetical protein
MQKTLNPNYPLPHEGQRTPVNDFSAIVTWDSHPELMALEVLACCENRLPMPLPKTYAIASSTHRYHYFAKTPLFKELLGL